MKTKIIAIMAIAALNLMSCNKSSSETQETKNQTFDEDLLKNLDKTATHIGIDANNNGIRDDVEDIIAKYPNTSTAEKNAMRQDAKAMQLVQVAEQKGELNKVKAREIAAISSEAVNCLFDSITDDDKELEIGKLAESLTANTEKRAMAYIKYNKLLSGIVSHGFNGKNTCSN